MKHIIVALALIVSCQVKKGTEKTTIIEAPAPPPIIGPLPNPVPNSPDFVRFANFESNILISLNDVSAAKRRETIHVDICDKFNEKRGGMPAFRQAIHKGLNQLNNQKDELLRAKPSDPNECIFKFNLDDYGLTRDDWKLIQKYDPFKLESFTARGLLIKQLTGLDRPWIHASNLNFIALNANVYYKILDVPSNVAEIWPFLGVNIQDEFDSFDDDLFMLGFFGSPISIQKNRMLLRIDGRDGPVWSTYDTIVVNQINAGRNLFENPFPVEARSRRVFEHDGQEFIYTLPNGLHGYILADAVGNLQTEAPLNLVFDVNSGGLSPVILNGYTCLKCHNGGVISAQDQVREHIDGNPNFDAVDSQLSNSYFRPKAANDAIFRRDQLKYREALAGLGINASDPDPVNVLSDDFRREWDLNQLASFYFLTTLEMRNCIEGSATAREQIGSVLNGSTVSLDNVIRVNPFLIRDCNLFQDDLNQ